MKWFIFIDGEGIERVVQSDDITIEYRVLFNSGDSEQITVSGASYNACIKAALAAATKRYNRDGSRDEVTSIELWERRA